MTTPTGRFADDRTYELPYGWEPVESPMLDTALRQALAAFGDDNAPTARAIENLLAYYDPMSDYSGAAFLGVPDLDDNVVTASDLWAVSTLSMSLSPRIGRALIEPGPLHSFIAGQLRRLDTSLPLSNVTPETLEVMYRMYGEIRSKVTTRADGSDSNQWVLAAKLCTRKRPLLFPVRDSRVCTYLAANPSMRDKEGHLGSFTRDIQVFAYLITHPEVHRRLLLARKQLIDAQPEWRFDIVDLRFLDAVLWMAAVASPHTAGDHR